MKLTELQRKVLKSLVKNRCEECGGLKELHIHRIKRGYAGGEYIPRNIKVVCHGCHKLYHYGEFK